MAILAFLSFPKAGPSTVKGLAILAFLSASLPVAARFFAKRLAKGGALAFRWCAHGARTAKLLRTWPCAEHWLPNGLAACGFTLRQWPCRLRHGSAAQGGAMALPMAGCAAVLQGAPRARPTGRPMPRTWASAPQKKRAARGMACERDVLRTGPFPCRRHSLRAARQLDGKFFLPPAKKPCHRRGKICYNLGN